MRIGILTLQLHTNYGGILQAYALQTVLERMGYDVKVITFPYLMQEPTTWKYFKRIFAKYIKRKPIEIFREKKYNKPLLIIRTHTQRFINSHIHQALYNSLLDVREEDFDCIVVGSDQVWRYEYEWCFQGIFNAYLLFTKGWHIKRFSYAASFGLSEWNYPKDVTDLCSSLAQAFNAISVRELDAITLCADYLKVQAEFVLDPTLLLLKEDYQSLYNSKYKSRGNLFYYMLDSSIDICPVVERLQQRKEYVLFTVNSKCDDSNVEMKKRIHPPVEQWLNAFDDAEFVITDSFHGCVFSIIYHKPFMVFMNRQGGASRIISLLSVFGLENRIVSNDFSTLTKEIDWAFVDEKLNDLKIHSLSFIKKVLEV